MWVDCDLDGLSAMQLKVLLKNEVNKIDHAEFMLLRNMVSKYGPRKMRMCNVGFVGDM